MIRPRYWLAGALIAGCLAVSANAQFVSQVVNSVAVGGITGLGANVATALGIAVGSAGGPVTFNGAGGTPSSMTGTNITGLPTASFNANAVTNAKMATMSASTIKGQIVAGSGDPVDMTATQAAAVIGSVGGALKSKLITSTRDLSVASNTVAYTGMGFQPTACIGLGGIIGFANSTFFGMVDSARSAANSYSVNGTQFNVTTNFLTFTDVAGTNQAAATISSYDSDGLTLSWTKTASPTGTATFYIMCFR